VITIGIAVVLKTDNGALQSTFDLHMHHTKQEIVRFSEKYTGCPEINARA
jgi:hypothetical protein